MKWATDIAYETFLGLNVLGWMGIIAFLLLCCSAALQIFKKRSIALRKFSARWHSRIASVGLGVAFLHGLLALFARFG